MENDIARLELAAAHRALAFYGLNEGVNNHMTTLCHSKYDSTRRVMLMLPFGTLWCEARPDDLVEIDPSTEAIVTLTGDVKLDFVTRSGELLMGRFSVFCFI